MNDRRPSSPGWGFRLSITDGMILVAAAALAVWLRTISFPLWWIVPAALGHFFLFCNVFLVWRRWELIWAFSFVVNVLIHASLDLVSAPSCLLWQLPVTITVIAMQMRSPWYHGIFARRINPRLDDYLNSKL